MKTIELYKQILLATEEVTEVDSKAITGKCRRQEVIDARWIVVLVLHDFGIYTHKIAELMGISERHINRIVEGADDRKRYGGITFCQNLEAVQTIVRQMDLSKT